MSSIERKKFDDCVFEIGVYGPMERCGGLEREKHKIWDDIDKEMYYSRCQFDMQIPFEKLDEFERVIKAVTLKLEKLRALMKDK